MKKQFISLLIISVSMVVFCSGLFASESQVFIRGIRPLGMGGAFVALSDDQNAVFYNPAGLTQRDSSLATAVELPINLSDDVFKFYSFFSDNEQNLKDFDSLPNVDQVDIINQINDKMVTYQPRIRTGFPNTSYFGKTSVLNWGVGLFNQAELGFQFNRSLLIPSISFWGNVDLITAAPIAYCFETIPFMPGKISAGTTLKYINRARISELNKSVLEFEKLDPKMQWGSGFGMDLGALYQPNDRWNVGLQITDFGGTTISYNETSGSDTGDNKKAFKSMIYSKMNIGTAYIPSSITYWPGKSIKTSNRLIFALDIRDFASSDEPLFEATFWKKLHMGAEFRISTLSLRGGFNSGYPTFGIGARVPYMGLKAEYAYWADELGRYAGQIPSWNHQLNLSLSWGDAGGRQYGKAKSEEGKKPVKQKVKKDASVKKVDKTLKEVSISTTTAAGSVVTEPVVEKPATSIITDNAAVVPPVVPSEAEKVEKEIKSQKPAEKIESNSKEQEKPKDTIIPLTINEKQ